MASELDENEEIFRNVSELKRRLHQTEVSLQQLQTPRHGSLTESDSHDLLSLLSLRDLDDEHHSSARRSINSVRGENSSNSKYRESRSWSKLTKKSAEVKDKDLLMDKLHQVREENSVLVQENNKLQNELESSNTALRTSQVKALQQLNDVDMLKKEVKTLKSELRAKDKNLRSVERELERSLMQKQQWEDFINESRKETDSIRSDLNSEADIRQQVEKEKSDVEQLLLSKSRELKDYKLMVSKQLKEQENTKQYLETSLQHCDKEREVLLEKATSLEDDLQKAREEVRSLKLNFNQLSAAHSASKELEEVIRDQENQLHQLRDKLEEAEKENEELKDTNKRQGEQLIEITKDLKKRDDDDDHRQTKEQRKRVYSITSESSLSTISHSAPVEEKHFYLSPESARLDGVGAETREEEDSGERKLEADQTKSPKTAAAELRMKNAIKNAELQRDHARWQQRSAGLDTNQGVMEGLRSELLMIVEQSKIDARKSSKLQEIINKMDVERNQEMKKLQTLEDQLEELKEEKDALNRQCKLRDSHFRQIQKDIEEKSSKLSDLMHELQRKDMQVVSLESQLDKTTRDFKEQLSSLSEADVKLREKNNQFESLKKKFTEESKHLEEMVEQLEGEQSLHAEQCKELEHHISQLQDEVINLKATLDDESKRNESCQKQVTEKTVQIGQLEAKLHQTQMILEQKNSEFDMARHALERQMKEGWSKSAQLEAALVLCKEELSIYFTKLKQMKEKHELEKTTKTHEVLKLEKQLQHAVEDIEEKSSQTATLERTLEERQGMLQESTQRISELEERESQLEEQVGYWERELTKVKAQNMEESTNLESKLSLVSLKLKEKTDQLQELNKTYSKVKLEVQEFRKSACTLESELANLQRNESKQRDQLATTELKLQTAENELAEQNKKVLDLKEALYQKDEEKTEQQTHSKELDVELNRARGELQEASRQLTELQHLLQMSRSEVKEKKQLINEMKEDLRETKNELESKENDLREMETVLKNSHEELEERTKQVNQFDHVVKQHQTTIEARVKELEAQLSQSREEVQQLIEKKSDLEQRCFEHIQELKLQSFQKQNVEVTLQTKDDEIGVKETRISTMEEEMKQICENLREEKMNNKRQNQELEMIHQQYQRANQELIKLRKEFSEAQSELENSSKQLEELSQTCRSKDSECTRLARLLGEAKAREVTAQSHLTSEMSKVTQQQHYELEQKEQELADLQKDHFQLLTLKDQQLAELNCLKDREAKLRGQIKYFEEQEKKLQDHLTAKDEILQAANESLVIKEAECARLSAQISGYERALSTRRMNFSPLSKLSSPHASQSSVISADASPKIPPFYHSMSDSVQQRGLYLENEAYHSPLESSNHSQVFSAKHNRRSTTHPQRLECSENYFKQPLEIREEWTSDHLKKFQEVEEANLMEDHAKMKVRDSVEGVNITSFQDMLSYVNRKILEDERQAIQSTKSSEVSRNAEITQYGRNNQKDHSSLNQTGTLESDFRGLGVRGIPEGKQWHEEISISLNKNEQSQSNLVELNRNDMKSMQDRTDYKDKTNKDSLNGAERDLYGLGNAMPFISSLLAHSVDSPTSSDKTGGSFPRGVDPPSSVSTKSDREVISNKDSNSPNEPRNNQRPRKAQSKGTSRKSVNRSLFDNASKKGKPSMMKKTKGNSPVKR